MNDTTKKRCYYCNCVITEDNEHEFKKGLKLSPDVRLLLEGGSMDKLTICKDCYKKKSGRNLKKS